MSRTTQEFGSAHTQKKLAAVQSYLSAFTTALKKHEICRRDDVAFFFKQRGGQNKKAAGRELHGRTYDEYPLELEA